MKLQFSDSENGNFVELETMDRQTMCFAMRRIIEGLEKVDIKFYRVAVTSPGPNKIRTIKAIREYTGIVLKEAKDLVEGFNGGVLPNLVPELEIKRVVRLIEETGATVEANLAR